MTIQLKSIQIKSNNDSDGHISDLQDDETGLTKDLISLYVQELI